MNTPHTFVRTNGKLFAHGASFLRWSPRPGRDTGVLEFLAADGHTVLRTRDGGTWPSMLGSRQFVERGDWREVEVSSFTVGANIKRCGRRILLMEQ